MLPTLGYFLMNPLCEFNVITFFQTHNKLIAENKRLQSLVDAKDEQITVLKTQIGTIRKNTISFILEQMDALHIQRDSQV